MKSFDPFAKSEKRKPVIAQIVDPSDESISATFGFVATQNDMFLTAQIQDEQTKLDSMYGKGEKAIPFMIAEVSEAFYPTPSQIAIAAGLAVATQFGDDTCEKWDGAMWLRVLYKWPQFVSQAMAKLTEVNSDPKATA